MLKKGERLCFLQRFVKCVLVLQTKTNDFSDTVLMKWILLHWNEGKIIIFQFTIYNFSLAYCNTEFAQILFSLFKKKKKIPLCIFLIFFFSLTLIFLFALDSSPSLITCFYICHFSDYFSGLLGSLYYWTPERQEAMTTLYKKYLEWQFVFMYFIQHSTSQTGLNPQASSGVNICCNINKGNLVYLYIIYIANNIADLCL